jgi:hypothetical protein
MIWPGFFGRGQIAMRLNRVPLSKPLTALPEL